ncbi:AMP-dependent synthetase/ligase [Psychromonas sp. Urea-02u-13]|uniref:AMP-dependent synthetase/ligase n=1 Tax=Psychromonas sp. Urea-02u-13 TaxID=2058326 RepID=UPI000C336D03|nr:long-chain fatty acid--CoA ligase [Psychromonas sp. Urea-02u-13]PKG40224.1 long-chain fatty acid--CoA ligase [Psychromonas sp. Urea-02u-13]
MINYQTLPEMIQHVVNTYTNSSALNYKYHGQWKSLSSEKFSETIRRLALGLRSLGVDEYDGFAIISPPSPQWVMIDLAIMLNRAISVPMFANVSSKHFAFQKKDSNIKYIFISDSNLLDDNICAELKSFRKVISLENNYNAKNGLSFQKLLELGDELSNQQPQLFALMRNAVKPEDVATIIYTSGSTGEPKGVEISHQNLISQIKATHERFPLDPQKDKILTCLPLAHVFERMVGYYYISTGTPLYFADDIKKVGDLLREIKPTVITLVPRLLEKVYAKMNSRIEDQSGLKRKLMSSAFERAIDKIPAKNSLSDKIFDKLIYSKLRAALGGNLTMLIVGGSALSESMEHFFKNIGFNVYQGYGLTESSPVLAVNFPGNVRYRTVGKIYPGVEVKIASDNEILAKGPNVMVGYHNNEQATNEVIDSDGWLHTGDLGSLDADGYLTITGRKKELFKTSNGKYVSPVPIEQRLCKSPLIDMAAIIGENHRFVSCLLFPDYENLDAIREHRGYGDMSNSDFLNSSEVKHEIKEAVQAVNDQLSAWEKIQKYKFVKHPITIETGELTPTMKLRRHVIEAKFKDIIDDFYA